MPVVNDELAGTPAADLDWDDYHADFTPDGRRLELRVQDVSIDERDNIFQFLQRVQSTIELYVDGTQNPLPRDAAAVMSRGAAEVLLKIDLGGVVIDWLFSQPNDIVMQFDPSLIDSRPRATVVFKLLGILGRRLRKRASLSREGQAEPALFEYLPGGRGVVYARRERA